MIIFLAGLRQIPQDIYEAASIDGAQPVRQFSKITLPLLTPVIFFNAVIQTIEAFKASRRPSSSATAPADRSTRRCSTRSTSTRRPSRYFRMGYASALAWILLLIIAAFTALSFLSARYWVHYDD
jgi:multiple sugar transport system permease protein